MPHTCRRSPRLPEVPAGGALVVAADGGNSKTDLVLADTGGAVLSRLAGPGTRGSVDGPAVTAERLSALVDAARERAGVAGRPVRAAVLDLANVDLPEEHAELTAVLLPLGIADHLELGNDTLAVLRAGAPQGWGVAAVSGSGVNALGVAPDGRTEGFLSLGRISGDWGGGGGIVSSAQFAAIRAEDGRGPATSLRHDLPAHFGLAAARDLAIAVHRGRIDAVTLLGAAPVVFAAANAGDAVAASIVRGAGREVARMVVALHRRLALPPAAPIVLGGAILQSGERLLLDALDAELADSVPGARAVPIRVPPVAGTLDRALELAGASAAARAAARDALRVGSRGGPHG